MMVKRQLSYSGFRRYLNYQLVDLNYLTPNKLATDYHPWRFYLAFFICIVNQIKLSIIFCQNEVTNLSYYIGDITLPAGKTKKHLTLIYSSWIIGTFMCTVTLYRSQYTPRLQKWIDIGIIFEHLSTRVHPISRLPTIVHKYFIRFCFSVFCSAGFSAILICLPSFFIYPHQFLIYIWIWLFITFLAGLIIVGHGCGFGPLYAAQIYLFGAKMSNHTSSLIQRLNFVLAYRRIKKTHLSSIVYRSVQSSTSVLRELVEGYHFWIHYNQAIFLATFIAQSIVLYLICFVDIPKFLRLALIVLGFINWITGLSIHFFLGAYGQRKIGQHCSKLRRTLYLNISNQMKLRLVNYFEHVESRYFFSIFGSINYSLYHFLLVVLENATNLLLLITTLGK
ncbi:uncharacterized protein LOC128394055 [Panonychus citri]|uniref:uncharacterized protein LOC128394055 n=1 Tax=Panonychus citri TaxID=50023 RepID=UPI002307DE44|nr:uncharacterized protein LOC128394055 [Panonychus citri]